VSYSSSRAATGSSVADTDDIPYCGNGLHVPHGPNPWPLANVGNVILEG
jgi:hypothetical protein